MKKSIKILLIVLISIVAVAGIAVGAYYLFSNNDDEQPSKYTEVEKNLIDSVNGSTGKVESDEQEIILPTPISLTDVVSIYDNYIVVTVNGSECVVRREQNPSIINFPESAYFDTVICVYGDYALVKNSSASGAKSFVVNLKEANVVCSEIEYDEYYKNGSTFGGYAFVGNFLVVSTTNETLYFDDEYFVKVYNLNTGALSLDLESGASLSADDKVLSYDVSDRFLIVKTLRKSVVYDLLHENASGMPVLIRSFDNDIVELLSNATSYDYRIGDLKYKINTEYKLTVLSDNKIFVDKYVQMDLVDDAQFYIDQEIYDDYNNTWDIIERYYSQFCYVYDVANDKLSEFSMENNMLSVQSSNLEGFALIISQTINEDKSIGVFNKTANYYELANFSKVVSYNYYKYGKIIGFADDKFVCAGSSYGAVLDLKGNVLFEGNVGLKIIDKKAYDGYFVVASGTKYGLYDVNGNVVLEPVYKNVSPVVGGHSIVYGNDGTVYNFDVSTLTLTRITNFYSDFVNYSMIGLDYYVTNANSKFQIYSVQGTLIKDNIDEIKLIEVDGGVATVYNDADKIKVLTSKNVSANETSVVASVSFVGLPKYCVINKVAYAENLNEPVLVANSNGFESESLATYGNGDTESFNLLDTMNSVSVSGFTYYQFQSSLSVWNKELPKILNKTLDYNGDKFTYVNGDKSQPGSQQIYYAYQKVYPVAGNTKIYLKIELTIYAEFAYYMYKGSIYRGITGVNEAKVNNAYFSHMGHYYNFTSTFSVSCASNYFIGMGQLSTTSISYSYYDSADIKRYESGYYRVADDADGFQVTSYTSEVCCSDYDGYENRNNYDVYSIELGDMFYTISPVKIAQLNAGANRDGTGLYFNYYSSYFAKAGVSIRSDRQPNLFEHIGTYPELILLDNNGKFVVYNDETGNHITCYEGMVQEGVLTSTDRLSNVDLFLVETYTQLYFYDEEVNIIADAIENENSGVNGSVVVFNSSQNRPFTVDEIKAMFPDNGYYIYSGGTQSKDGKHKFAGTIDAGYYGLYDNLKVSGFPFEFRKAGYSIESLIYEAVDTSIIGPVLPDMKGVNSLNPVYSVGSSGKLAITQYTNGSVPVKLGDVVITGPTSDYESFEGYPVYQLFRSPNSSKKVLGEDGNEYDLWFNGLNVSALQTTWEPNYYSLYFYTEQDILNGDNLVGAVDDWYFKDLDNEGKFTFSSSEFAGLSVNSSIIKNGRIDVNGVSTQVVCMNSVNKFAFGSTLQGLPIPVKFGYKFLGFMPMVVNASGNLEPILDSDGNEIIIFDGDNLNINNCDYDNANKECYFKAVFEANDYTVSIDFGSDEFFALNGFDARLASWEDFDGWQMTNTNSSVVFSKTFNFDDLRNLNGILTIPSPVETRWQVANFALKLQNLKLAGQEGEYFNSYYVPYNLNENGQEIQTNSNVSLAKKFNLVQMLSGINETVKSKTYSDGTSYYIDTINTENDGNSSRYYVNNGYNIETLNLVAIPIIVDYFVELNADGMSGAQVLGNYYVSGDKNNAVEIKSPKGQALGESYSNITFVELNCLSLDYRFEKLEIKIYTGVNSEYVTLNYEIIWKNNVYFGVNYTGFTATNGMTGDEVANLIGLGSEVQFSSIVGFGTGTNGYEEGLIVYIPKLKTGIENAENDDVIKYFNEEQDDFGETVQGNLNQIYIKSIELNFKVKETDYNIVMGAFDGDSISVSDDVVNQMANEQIEANSNSNLSSSINIGAMADKNLTPEISTINNSHAGYATTSVLRNGSKILTILNGGDFTSNNVYSHFVSTIIVANLSSTYNLTTNSFEYSVNDYLTVDVEFNISHYASGGQRISVTINGADYILVDDQNGGVQGLVRADIDNGHILRFEVSSRNGETFELSVSYEVKGELIDGQNIVENDILVATLFKEYKHGEFESNVFVDGVLDENKSSSKIGEDAFNACISEQLRYVADNGYYLKKLKISDATGNNKIVLQGYPYFDYNTLSVKFKYQTQNLTGSSPYYFDETLISVGGFQLTGQINSQQIMNLELDQTAQIILDLYGLYRKVNIEVYYESVTAIYVENSIVQFDNTNISDLDYNALIHLKNGTSISLKNLSFSAWPNSINNCELETKNYYYADLNASANPNYNFTMFLILGSGFEYIDFNIDGNYKNYISISTINNLKPSNTETVSGIYPTANVITVMLAKNLHDFTLNIDFGYYVGDAWQSYTSFDYYNSNNYSLFNELISKRFDYLFVEYFGSMSNPTIMSDINKNDLDKYSLQFKYFNGTEVSVSWALNNNYYSLVPDVFGATSSQYSIENGKIIFNANSNIEDKNITLRFIANVYQLQYMPNKPATAEDVDVTYGAGLILGEDGEQSYIIEVWFDAILSSSKHLDESDNLKLKGHTFTGWNTNENGSGYYLTAEMPLDERFLVSQNEINKVYAQWIVKQITVTFNLNDSKVGNGSSEASYNGYEINHQYTFNDVYGQYLPVATRFGYTLLGWSKRQIYAEQIRNEIITADSHVDEDANYTIYAVWEPNTYTVTYYKAGKDMNGNALIGDGIETFASNLGSDFIINGDGSVSISIKFDSAFPAHPNPEISLKGYDFMGWFINNDESTPIGGNTILLEKYIINDKVSVYPHWQLQGVKVLLITSKGSIDLDNTLLDNLALSNLIWLLKDVNGGNNGVVNNFTTHSVVENGLTIYYNINIPYYSSAGTVLQNSEIGILKAPTSAGYNFCGYYYYNGYNFMQYIKENSDNECELVRTWDIEWDKQNPIKLYAQWEIKTFKVSLSVGASYQNLFNGLCLPYAGYEEVALKSLNSNLAITLIKKKYANGDYAIDETVTQSLSLTSSATIEFEIDFYERIEIQITMAEGHYMSAVVVGDGTVFNGTWNNSDKTVSGLNSVYSGKTRIGSLDALNFQYGEYYGVNSNVEYSKKYKRDMTGVIEHVLTNYSLDLQFARQTFKVSIVQLRVNNDGSFAIFNTLEYTLPFKGVFNITDLEGIPFYSTDNKYYTDARCTIEYIGTRTEILDNLTLYCKYVSTANNIHEGVFYGFGAGGYEIINTGSNYIYATINNGIRYINGQNGYLWTDCLSGQKIIKFPVVTAFYWPNGVDDVYSGLQFVYWVKFADDVNVQTGIPLTPYILLTQYEGKFTIAQSGITLNANDKFYAVFESYDKKVYIDSIEGESDGSRDDYYISYNGNWQQLKFKLGASKIDVYEAFAVINYNGNTYEISAERTSVKTEDIYYTFNLLHNGRFTYSGGAVSVKFKIVSSVGNIYYTNEQILTIVNNVSSYLGSTVNPTSDRITNPLGGYSYLSINGGYYNSAEVEVRFSYGGNTETRTFGVPALSAGPNNNDKTSYTVVIGSTTYIIEISINYSSTIRDENTGSDYWIYTVSVSVTQQ